MIKEKGVEIMLKVIRKLLFKRIPSPYENSSLYWMDLIPFVGFFLIRHFDIHLVLKAEHPALALLLVLLLPVFFAFPVLDLWPKAYGAESEGLADGVQEFYRRSVRKRLAVVAAVILMLLVFSRQINI